MESISQNAILEKKENPDKETHIDKPTVSPSRPPLYHAADLVTLTGEKL